MPTQLINYMLSSLQRCATYMSADPKHKTWSGKTEISIHGYLNVERQKSNFCLLLLSHVRNEVKLFALSRIYVDVFCLFLREKVKPNQNYISPFVFAINLVLNLSIAKPTAVNFLRLFAVCGRIRNFLQLLADLISLRLELLADKAQFNFFSPLVCSCGARTSCATSCVCIIFGLYCTRQDYWIASVLW